jgi:hypothetical protein
VKIITPTHLEEVGKAIKSLNNNRTLGFSGL